MERLFNLARLGICVRVITADCVNNEEAVESIRDFVYEQNSMESAQPVDFEALIIGSADNANHNGDYGVHAKIYIVDSSYAVTGSANLTHGGFSNNIELLTICDPPEVADLEKKFDELWVLYERETNAAKEAVVREKPETKKHSIEPPASLRPQRLMARGWNWA